MYFSPIENDVTNFRTEQMSFKHFEFVDQLKRRDPELSTQSRSLSCIFKSFKN